VRGNDSKMSTANASRRPRTVASSAAVMPSTLPLLETGGTIYHTTRATQT
jgi:hypothetical protein